MRRITVLTENGPFYLFDKMSRRERRNLRREIPYDTSWISLDEGRIVLVHPHLTIMVQNDVRGYEDTSAF